MWGWLAGEWCDLVEYLASMTGLIMIQLHA
jgi:hypothetical protein